MPRRFLTVRHQPQRLESDCFYLNDPAFTTAPQIVTHGDLELAWIAYDSYYAVIQPA